MKIAHISDLHFFHFSPMPTTFFSKRLLATLNYLFFRRKVFNHKQLFSLIELFKKEKVDLVIISGDLTTTGQKKELYQARRFVNLLKDAGFDLLIIPGNHDFYLKRDERKKTFYKYFQNAHERLKKNKVESGPLTDNWWYVALDTTYASPPLSSEGRFSKEVEQSLTETLEKVPKDAYILLVNHFPLFAPDGPRKALVRREYLCDLIKQFPAIKLYLHGHTHRQSIADLRTNSLPIMLDAGCTSYAEQGSLHILTLDKDQVDVDLFFFQRGDWQKAEKRNFSLASV